MPREKNEEIEKLTEMVRAHKLLYDVKDVGPIYGVSVEPTTLEDVPYGLQILSVHS